MNYGLDEIRIFIKNEMLRLDQLDILEKNAKTEIDRAGAISQNAISYIKSVDMELKLYNARNKLNK